MKITEQEAAAFKKDNRYSFDQNSILDPIWLRGFRAGRTRDKLVVIEHDHMALKAKEHALRLDFHIACDPLCADGRQLLQTTPDLLRNLAGYILSFKAK